MPSDGGSGSSHRTGRARTSGRSGRDLGRRTWLVPRILLPRTEARPRHETTFADLLRSGAGAAQELLFVDRLDAELLGLLQLAPRPGPRPPRGRFGTRSRSPRDRPGPRRAPSPRSRLRASSLPVKTTVRPSKAPASRRLRRLRLDARRRACARASPRCAASANQCSTASAMVSPISSISSRCSRSAASTPSSVPNARARIFAPRSPTSGMPSA